MLAHFLDGPLKDTRREWVGKALAVQVYTHSKHGVVTLYYVLSTTYDNALVNYAELAPESAKVWAEAQEWRTVMGGYAKFG